MTYSLSDYAENIAKCHVNTVKKMIKNQILPSMHRARWIDKRTMVIDVLPKSDKCSRCDDYFNASIEFNERKKGYTAATVENKQFNFELAAELCVKFDLGATKFFKMHGL